MFLFKNNLFEHGLALQSCSVFVPKFYEVIKFTQNVIEFRLVAHKLANRFNVYA